MSPAASGAEGFVMAGKVAAPGGEGEEMATGWPLLIGDSTGAIIVLVAAWTSVFADNSRQPHPDLHLPHTLS